MDSTFVDVVHHPRLDQPEVPPFNETQVSWELQPLQQSNVATATQMEAWAQRPRGPAAAMRVWLGAGGGHTSGRADRYLPPAPRAGDQLAGNEAEQHCADSDLRRSTMFPLRGQKKNC